MKKETAHYVLFGFLVLLSCLLFFTACLTDNPVEDEKNAKTETDDDNDDDTGDDDDNDDNDDDNNDNDDNDDNDDDDDIDDPEMMFLIHSSSIGRSLIYKRLSNGSWMQYSLPQINSSFTMLYELDLLRSDLVYAAGISVPDKSSRKVGLLLKYDGLTWSVMQIDNAPLDWQPFGISFFDEDHGYMVGSQGGDQGDDLPVVMQYESSTWNDISPSHLTDENPFSSVIALSENSFIAVGKDKNDLSGEDDVGVAFRWDTGTWTEIPIEDPDVVERWYLWKIISVSEGDLAGIYSIGMYGNTTDQSGLLFKYNEYLNVFELLYTSSQVNLFLTAAYNDEIISIVGHNGAGQGILGKWDGSSYSSVLGPLVGTGSAYIATQVANANDIWLAGSYTIDSTHHNALIHRYRDNVFEQVSTPDLGGINGSIYDFVILE